VVGRARFIVAHFLIGLSLAAFAAVGRISALEEPQVPQLTIMQAPEPTPPPVVPKNAPMTTVDPARKSAVAPKEKTFEANENSIAAAEKAATTDNQLPGQDGKDRPFMNLEEHDYSLANKGAAPQSKPSPTPTPKRTDTERNANSAPPSTPTPAPDQLALTRFHLRSLPDGIGRDNGDSHADGNADLTPEPIETPQPPPPATGTAEDGHPWRDQ
jgi:hypothetical protein